MKKSTITLILVFAFANVFSMPNNTKTSEYVETESGIIYVKNLRYGLNNFIVAETTDGVKVALKRNEVKSYKKEGKIFKQLNFYKNNNSCAACAFLEQVYTKAGYTLYKYLTYNAGGKETTNFYLFKGDRFEKRVTKDKA